MAIELRRVDAAVWKGCAGISVQIPAVDSLVYYFPQGHAEHCSSPPFLSPLAASRSFYLCRILAVDLLANPDTDEVLAKIRLHPISRRNPEPPRAGANSGDDGVRVVAFAKVLTSSDANNGGGFSVPRYCAESIFPPLDFEADPPVQTLTATDVHGNSWKFRHIYRGTPRRHLLTTGWSKFVNAKLLIAGDSVVFMKRPDSTEIFIGVRRAVRASGTVDCGRWNDGVGNVVDEEGGRAAGFTRSSKGKVSPETVVATMELAAQDMAFEVVYYPRAGAADFLVRAELVEPSVSTYWTPGMKVKMAMETEDSSKMEWLYGTVSTAALPATGPWEGSPWRMLEVAWDGQAPKCMKRISPWLVKLDFPNQPPDAAFQQRKRLRAHQGPGMLTDRGGEPLFPMTAWANPVSQIPSFFSYESSPAGMQGARQDTFSSLPNFSSENTQMCGVNLFDMPPTVKNVSFEPNVGSSPSGNLSAESQDSGQFSSMTPSGNNCFEPSTEVGDHSFQLFGQKIYIKRPAETKYRDGRGF